MSNESDTNFNVFGLSGNDTKMVLETVHFSTCRNDSFQYTESYLKHIFQNIDQCAELIHNLNKQRSIWRDQLHEHITNLKQERIIRLAEHEKFVENYEQARRQVAGNEKLWSEFQNFEFKLYKDIRAVIDELSNITYTTNDIHLTKSVTAKRALWERTRQVYGKKPPTDTIFERNILQIVERAVEVVNRKFVPGHNQVPLDSIRTVECRKCLQYSLLYYINTALMQRIQQQRHVHGPHVDVLSALWELRKTWIELSVNENWSIQSCQKCHTAFESPLHAAQIKQNINNTDVSYDQIPHATLTETIQNLERKQYQAQSLAMQNMFHQYMIKEVQNESLLAQATMNMNSLSLEQALKFQTWLQSSEYPEKEIKQCLNGHLRFYDFMFRKKNDKYHLPALVYLYVQYRFWEAKEHQWGHICDLLQAVLDISNASDIFTDQISDYDKILFEKILRNNATSEVGNDKTLTENNANGWKKEVNKIHFQVNRQSKQKSTSEKVTVYVPKDIITVCTSLHTYIQKRLETFMENSDFV
jgi:hypothetical protein